LRAATKLVSDIYGRPSSVVGSLFLPAGLTSKDVILVDLIRVSGHPQQAIEAVRLEKGGGKLGVLLLGAFSVVN
jgi:hypothetical protein